MQTLETIVKSLESGDVTQVELSRISGIPQSTISTIITKKHSPRYETVQKLWAALQALRPELCTPPENGNSQREAGRGVISPDASHGGAK